MTDNGTFANDLGTEVWYRVETSARGADDWFAVDQRTFCLMIAAKCSIDRGITEGEYNTDEYEYRIVRVTTKTEWVGYTEASA